MEATAPANPTEEVTMSTATTVTLSSDLMLKSGTVPAGTVLHTSTNELRSLWLSVKLGLQNNPTLGCQHPFFDYAMVAVPSSYIVDYREVLQQARELFS